MHNFITRLREYISFIKGSYSQEGEDVVINSYLKNIKKGFYVDVGAHHPFRFSNTYMFYKKGWRGINIDATPGSMEIFNKYRPRDINLEVPVSNDHKEIDYYTFEESALNSFSQKLSKWRDANTNYKIKKVIKLKPKKLFEILDEKMPKHTHINFMSIDVEGFEYEVLTSNNWKKYRPSFLLIEVLRKDLGGFKVDRLGVFLKKQNYKLIDRIGRTSLFKNNE